MADLFPYPQNITNLFGMFQHVDAITTNSFGAKTLGIALLVAIAAVSFISAKSFSSDKAFGFAGFITLLSAILLGFMGLITPIVLYIIIFAFVGIIIWMWTLRSTEV